MIKVVMVPNEMPPPTAADKPPYQTTTPKVREDNISTIGKNIE